jgi:hypothetical protein
MIQFTISSPGSWIGFQRRFQFLRVWTMSSIINLKERSLSKENETKNNLQFAVEVREKI